MADRYWVGGTANWDGTAGTKWSTTSGGAGGSAIPGTGDKVYFDANSGAGTVTCTTSVTVQSVNFTGFTGTFTHNTSVVITINTAAVDSLLFSSSMTYSPAATSSGWTFTNTSGNADVTSNGKQLHLLTVNGAGGTVRLLDALRIDVTAGSTLTHTQGTFNANGFNVDLSVYSGSNSNTRTLTMGSGTWKVGKNNATGTIWNMTTTTGLTFSGASATVTVATTNSETMRTLIFGGARSIGTVKVEACSVNATLQMSGGPYTIGTFNCSEGNSLIWSGFSHVISSAMTLTGTPALPIAFLASTVGTAVSIQITGTNTGSWIAFRDMAFNTGTFTCTDSLDLGNATGVSVTSPLGSAALIADAVWDEDLSTRSNNIAKTGGAICRGTVTTGASTTSVPTSAFSPAGAAADQFKDRVILFDVGTSTASLRGQARAITASTNAATPTLTVDALTTAPSSGDTFSVI